MFWLFDKVFNPTKNERSTAKIMNKKGFNSYGF